MSFKSLWNRTREYGKRHTFHMVMIVAMVILGVAQFSQFAISGSIYGIIAMNENTFKEYTKKVTKDMRSDKNELLGAIKNKANELVVDIADSKMELNSKIDILDSAIKPEKKRRMLIVKVRNAITENTYRKLSIREINNMAVAIIDYSFQYDLSIAKVLAQIKVESDFKRTAKSSAGAEGLMQIIPETWDYVVLKEFSRKHADPFDINYNIRGGCFYMAEQILKFDTYDYALMAYNWGPHRVRKLISGEYKDKNIPDETRGYVKNINKFIVVFETYGLE